MKKFIWENFEAERNFITAVLRRESGAAIADSEFESAREVYIPLATDGQDVLDQKAEARRTVLQGLINEAGGAYTQLQTSLPTPPSDGLSDDEAYELYLKQRDGSN